MDKIKRYKDFKGRDYILDEVNDIVEGTLAYLSDEGFVFSTSSFFNDISIFINRAQKLSPPFDYDPFSWLDVKEYVISLFERLHKRFADNWNVKVYLKVGSYYHNEEEIAYQEMLNITDDEVKRKGLTNIFGVRICLS